MHRLMLGSGSWVKPSDEWITLDVNHRCNPDVLFDLNAIERGISLPFDDGYFDEIAAYAVMEHYGHQGDYRGFFTGMRELWRVLSPSGILKGRCPGTQSPWVWSDIGHCRVIAPETIHYLTRMPTSAAAADYSDYVKPCWWVVVEEADDPHKAYHFTLRKEHADA